MESFLLMAHIIIGFSSIISLLYCAYGAFNEKVLRKSLMTSTALFGATVLSGVGLIFAGAGLTRVCLMLVIYSTVTVGSLSFIRKKFTSHSNTTSASQF